jgi:hypothetical protein
MRLITPQFKYDSIKIKNCKKQLYLKLTVPETDNFTIFTKLKTMMILGRLLRTSERATCGLLVETPALEGAED